MTNPLRNAKSGLLSRFRHDTKGSIAMIAGLTAIPLMLAAGVAVDMARASHEQQAFQAALDSAALAIGASDKSKVAGLTPVQLASRYDELKALARKYIGKNYTPKFHDDTQISIDVSVSNNGHVILSGYHDFPTTIMQIAGINEMDITAKAEVEKEKIPNPALELVMVMDTTGSMGSNHKIQDAQQAGRDLLDIIYDGKTTSPYIKVGLVPFSGGVMVGSHYRNSGWIDVNGLSSVARLNFTDATWHNMKAWDQLANVDWNGCVEARPGAYATDDTTPTAGVPDTLFVPYFAPDEPNISGQGFYTDYITSSGSPNETTGISTSTSSSNWMPRQKNQNKYVNKTISTSSTYGPWFNCATAPIVPLTATKQTVVDGINATTASGSTVIPEGLGWGWRILSPGAPFTEGAAYNDPGWQKVMVLMTDGENDVLSNGNQINTLNGSWYSAYGWVKAATGNRFGTTTTSQANTKLDQKTSTLCTNIKAAGITVYTIAFDVTSSNIQTLLQNCASDPSKYFSATNGAELRAHFQAIGEEVLESMLRLSK